MTEISNNRNIVASRYRGSPFGLKNASRSSAKSIVAYQQMQMVLYPAIKIIIIAH